MLNKTLSELAKDISAGKYSCEEVVKFYLSRVKKLNEKLNCFITITEEQAYSKAKKLDQNKNSAKANSQPLYGIPIAQKDLFCTKGIKTSCGSKMLDNFISPYNATVVEKLDNAGAILLGKSNMDEFAMGSSNENSFYGVVKNPWNLECVPGGSSGGSAAAVAARAVLGATGTDTGGSIRQPAAFCGVTGIKPTYGRVSRFGMVAFASSLDQGGPIAQSAEDCALLLQAMAGFDTKDSTSVDKPVPDYKATLNDSLKGLKLGVPKEFFKKEELPEEMAVIVENAIKELEKLGAIVKPISLPRMHLSIPVYYVIAPAECSSNLARYDGVRFGHRCSDPKDLEDLYKRSRSEGFGDEVKRRIMIGTYVLSAGYYDAYYLKAQKVRRIIADDFKEAFAEVDVIVGPTTPEEAFKFNAKTADPINMYLSDIYTCSVNLAGLPGLSMPAGFINKLPVGVQLIGDYFSEAKLLNVAHQYQQVTDWHKSIPANIE